MTWNSADGLDLRELELGEIDSATRIDLDGNVEKVDGLELDRREFKDDNDHLYIKNLFSPARDLDVDLWTEGLYEDVLGYIDGAVRVCGDLFIVYVEAPPHIYEVHIHIEDGPDRRSYYREMVRQAERRR